MNIEELAKKFFHWHVDQEQKFYITKLYRDWDNLDEETEMDDWGEGPVVLKLGKKGWRELAELAIKELGESNEQT